jgi:hypothetical protein
VKYTGRWPNCENIACLDQRTSVQMRQACDANSASCTGFTFERNADASGGCLKACGNKEFGGFGVGTYDYFVASEEAEEQFGQTVPVSKLMRKSMMAVANAFRASLAVPPARYPAPETETAANPPCTREVVPRNLSKPHLRSPPRFPILLSALHIDPPHDPRAEISRRRSGIECRDDTETGASTCAYANVCYEPSGSVSYFADDLANADSQLEGAFFRSARDASWHVRAHLPRPPSLPPSHSHPPSLHSTCATRKKALSQRAWACMQRLRRCALH